LQSIHLQLVVCTGSPPASTFFQVDITRIRTKPMSSGHDSEDQLYSSEGEYRGGGHEYAIDGPSKHTRIDNPKPKAPRRKHAKEKQGSLQGIMTMPMEVLTEIVHNVHPGDLISLIRTNKFFRATLLNKSAIMIWQRALRNVPKLPRCPTKLVEPQYTALMFSNNCTLCGALAEGEPDAYLQVRLCSSCRETELGAMPMRCADPGGLIPWSRRNKPTSKSVCQRPVYYLIRQERELEGARDEFVRKGDRQGLAKWKSEQQTACGTDLLYKQDGKRLQRYLDSVAASRSEELKNRKSERREQIHEQLRNLGWEDKHFSFHSENAKKQWDSLVEVSKPVTDQTWNDILPKLTQLLEENRLQVDEFQRQLRRSERVSKAKDFLRQLRSNMHPYQSIADALQLEYWPFFKIYPLLSDPFPDEGVFCGWDFFSSIYEEENSPGHVEELLNERQDAFCQKVLEWRAQVEDQLVEQYKSSFTGNASPPTNAGTTLTIQGSTDATKHLSDNARFLLRADTVFVAKVPASSSEVDREHGPAADGIHFPAIRCISDGGFNPDTGETTLDSYVRHPGQEAIVKALLRELQMPNAAHVELANMGEIFTCGRCNHSKAMNWNELVEHYHLRRRDWVGTTFLPNSYQTQHPVIFRNLHDLRSDTNPKPLVRIRLTSSQESNGSVFYSHNAIAECIICQRIDLYDDSSFESLAKMREHMREVHDTVEPVKELHFVDLTFNLNLIFDGNERDRRSWEQKWDSFHETLGATSATVHQADSPSGPTSQTTNAS
ncbi:unnamed protein product, partial [Rhizoctonia solani]